MTCRAKFVVFCGLPHGLKIFQKNFQKRRRLAGQNQSIFRSMRGKGENHQNPPREGGEKMETTYRKSEEWGQFDRYCKLVLYHEAIDYLRELQRLRNNEVSLEVLSPAQWNKLSMTDYYPSDSYVFSSHGYELHISDELVADAFGELPQQEQSILILHFVLGMTDREISGLVGMSKSAVQRHKAKSLKELRIKLIALMPEGG